MIDSYINNLNKNSFKYLFKINASFLKIIFLIFFIIIILFSFLYNLLYQLKEKKNEENINTSYIIGNNSLYDLFKYPQISILLFYLNEINVNKIINYIENLKKQTLKDIQIIILIQKNKNINDYKILKNISIIDNRLEVISSKNRDLIYNIFHSMDILKGKFTIIMNESIKLEIEELQKFYNVTKGRINNIFSFRTKNGNSICMIRSKLLKDIKDNNLNFKNISDLIYYLNSINYPQLNYISIALCPDNYYTTLAYISMLSILNNKAYYTYISFYIIVPKNFSKKNIYLLKSLYDQYDLFNITFINMDDRYDKAFISAHISTQTYYRCSIAELLPYLNKIIYLDVDVIVYKDLTKLYNLNFNGKIILGQIGVANRSPKTGFYKINNGVLLLNLKEMRKIKFEQKVLNILNKGYKFSFHDQTLINRYFYKYISIFPPEYHTRPFKNYKEVIDYNQKSGNLYDKDFFFFTWKYPTIRHFLGYYKPIYNNINNIEMEDWWYFARISKYFIKKSKNLSDIFNFTYQ